VFSLSSIVSFYSSSGYLAVFSVLLLCGMGLPIPEDISIVAGGVISGLGYTNVHIMCVVSFFGVLAGDIIVYSLGRYFGEQIFSRKIGKRLLNNTWYDRIVKSFQKNGKKVLFAARFMPGLRAPIFLSAGITKFTGFGTFILIDGFAALISVPVWTYLGFYGASNMDVLIKWMKNTKIGILVVFLVLVAVFFISKLFKKKIVAAEIIMNNGNDK